MKKLLKILLLIIGIVYTKEYPALWVLIITYIIYNYFSGTAAKVYNFLEKNVAKLISHTCMRNCPDMIDGIRDEQLLTIESTEKLLEQFSVFPCFAAGRENVM